VSRSVLVTGAAGYIGSLLVDALAAEEPPYGCVVAVDVREVAPGARREGVVYRSADVRDRDLDALLREFAVDTVVHLAAIVTPGKRSSREVEYSVDVVGTSNVLDACVATGVRTLIVTSSGAAYGYHADNPVPLDEDDPLRGNPEFAYADHKRLVEEMLARARAEYPGLRQLVFRPGAVIGDTTANQITALFEKRVVLGVAGSDAPFTFVWDQDLVACLARGVREEREGIYNVAGDGSTPVREIARRMGRPYLPVPPWFLRGALRVLKSLRLTQYGPEQVEFLQYRPVLSNARLKSEFGYTPRLTSTDAFERWRQARAPQRSRG
jgi:UDP-glucose 4-epimerase